MQNFLMRLLGQITCVAVLLVAGVVTDRGIEGVSLVAPVQAQSGDKAKERETRKTPALRNAVYERLAEAQELAEAKDYVGAQAILDDMIGETSKKKALNSYELANVYNTYAFLRYANEDYKGSLNYYQLVIEQPDIPLALEINTRYTVAQLYFVQEDWKNGVDALNVWLDMTDKPNSNAFVLLANGYYQLKDYDESLRNINIAMDMEKAAGKIPKEQWYALAQFLYYDKGDIDNALEIVRTLILYYPKKQYWVQAAQIYTEKQDDERALAMLIATHEQGLLDRSGELVNLAYYYLNAEAPYPAAKVMVEGLDGEIIEPTSKNYELTGNAWRQAQEVPKSLPMLEIAASKAESGDLFTRLGSVYLDLDQNQKAADAIRKGLDRGGVKRPDQARLALGMALFNLGEFNAARRAFREAAKDNRAKTYAQQWLRYISSEENRLNELAKEMG